jgi:predicted DNA-binding protein
MDIKKDKKVRAAFTLDREVVEALDDFSLSTGQSKSAFVNDCLKQSIDHLKKLSEIINYAKANPGVDLAVIQSRINDELLKAKDSLDGLSKE